ncbi:MAG: right-handed parallel beta-helix repeat-containing protein [Gammaproteobacteria bacterium]
MKLKIVLRVAAALLIGSAAGAHATHTDVYVDIRSVDSPGCGAWTSPCATVAHAFSKLALMCASGRTPEDSFRVMLHKGQTFREVTDLVVPCDNFTVTTYNPTTKRPLECFPSADCAVITRARQIVPSEWTTDPKGLKKITVTDVKLQRATLIEPQNLFLSGDRADPQQTARLPEVRRGYFDGYRDEGRAYMDDMCPPADELDDGYYEAFPDCGKQVIAPGQWGQERIEFVPSNTLHSTNDIYFNDSNGRIGNGPQLEVSTAQFVMRTANPLGATREHVTIENVYMYGAGFTTRDEDAYPPGPDYTRRISSVLDVVNSRRVLVRNVRMEASPLYVISVRNDTKWVLVTNSDFSDSGGWCVDTRNMKDVANRGNVQFVKIAGHHCGNNLGDTGDGHGFGIQTANGVYVKDSVFYANGYAGGEVGRRFTLPNPTQRNVHSAFVLHRAGNTIVENNAVVCNWRSGVKLGDNDVDNDVLNNLIAGNGRINFEQVNLPLAEREERFINGLNFGQGCPNASHKLNGNTVTANLIRRWQGQEAGMFLYTDIGEVGSSIPPVSNFSGCTNPPPVPSAYTHEMVVAELQNNTVCQNYYADTQAAAPAFNCANRRLGGVISVLSATGNVADSSVTRCRNYDPTQDWAVTGGLCSGPTLPGLNELRTLSSCMNHVGAYMEPWK